jgi:hypothetical protein
MSYYNGIFTDMFMDVRLGELIYLHETLELQ